MLGSSVSTFIREQKFEHSKRRLEAHLARIISLMEGHKAADLPAGHKFYGILLTKATRAINAYQTRAKELGFDSDGWDDVAIGAPALLQLQRYATGEAKASNVLSIGIGVLIAGSVGTIALALFHNMYVYLTHWVH